MKIQCTNCDNIETTNTEFFVKLIGGSMPVGGYAAWTTYFFAGTGFAAPIVAAIISGGVAMLVFKDEIVQWIIDKGYECSNCKHVKWKPVANTEEKEFSIIRSLGGAARDFTIGLCNPSATDDELKNKVDNFSFKSTLIVAKKKAAQSGKKISEETLKFFNEDTKK
jgi:hypothetical protein